MKKVLALLAVASLLAAATSASAAITGSKHDLSNNGPGFTGGTKNGNTQICIYCHTPHSAAVKNVLWNRTNPGFAGFKLYSGVGMANKSFSSGFTADSTSLMCMSCHDGVTGVSLIHNAGQAGVGVTTGLVSSANANLTTDLSLTHPVNFPVTSNSQNDLFISPVGGNLATMGGDAPAALGTNTVGYPLFRSSRDAAGSTKSLECGSCHAVHDTTFPPFLRYTLGGSTICLGCHNK